MSEPRVIKRYSNRKLYDTANSRYVTLDQIAVLVKAGEEVSIIDNTSKDDLTSVTLAQIILEEEKRRKSFLPLSALKSIIRSGGEGLQDIVHSLRDGAGKFIGLAREGGAEPRSEEEKGRDVIREFLEGSQKAFEEWQKRVDEQVRAAVQAVTPVTLADLSRELRALRDRIEELECKLGGPGE